MKTLPLAPLAAATALVLSTPGAVRADDTVTILHTNDFHSRIEPISAYDGPCGSPEENAAGECFGGWARLVSAIDSARGRDPDALLVDGGDQFQGSLFYTQYKGKVAAEMMNALGYDAMTVGNHEFDDGPEVLRAFMDEVTFPVLMSNADVSAEPALAGKVKRSVVIEKGGERYGLIGLTTEDTDELSSPGKNVVFTDSAEAVQAEVDALSADGVERIIVLSHSGYATDLDVATRVKGIDVIVGGHTNTFLSNVDEGAAGPYPTMVGRTAVVQAYAYGKYLGELKVTFDGEGGVVTAEGEPIVIDGKVVEDADVLERIGELAEPLDAIRNRVVAESAGLIDGNRDVCRVRECSMGDLVADAMLDRVADQGISIAYMNSGGIRASIDEGEVTMGDVLTVLPFQNTLATFEIDGADLLVALENGVSEVEEVQGRFPQVAGLTFAFDVSRPVGERVSDVMVVKDGKPVPIDPAASYGVVTNNYVRGGGDGYDVFGEKARNVYDYGPNLEDVVAGYLAENGPYEPTTDGRIRAD